MSGLPAGREPSAERQTFVRSPAAVMLVSAAGQILMASDRMADMLGVTPADMRDCALPVFLGSGPLHTDLSHQLRALLEDRVVTQSFLRPDRTELAATVSLTPLRGAGAAVTSVLMVVSPMSARAVAAAGPEYSGHGHDLDIATFSHELRTPLHAILGSSELLLEDLDGDIARRRELTETVDVSARHLLALINDMLDIMRLRSGKVVLDISLVSIGDVLESSLAFVRHAAAAKSIRIYSPSVVDPTGIWTDARRLKQIVVNLLDNAIKFTGPGGSVFVATTFTREHGVTISVRDTGIGIRPDVAHRIFEPFEQVATAFARSFGGTGLGLPVVKGLVETLGGAVTLTTTVGVGSEFVVWLPIGVPDDAPAS